MHSQDFEKRSLFHVQSESSIGRASMTLRELFLQVSQMNSIQKIILTEYQTLASSMEAYRLMQEYKIDVCVGIEVTVHWKQSGTSMDGTILLLPKDRIGQKVIVKALSKAYKLKMDGEPWFDIPSLEHWFAPGSCGHGHVMATTGGKDGLLYRLLSQSPQARRELQWLQDKKRELMDPNSPEAKELQKLAENSDASHDVKRRASNIRKQSRKWYELINEEKKLQHKIKRKKSNYSIAASICKRLVEIFGQGNLYVELVSHQQSLEAEVLPLIVQAAADNKLLLADEARYAGNTKDEHRRQWLIEKICSAPESSQSKSGNFSIKTLEETVSQLQRILPMDTIQRGLSGREECANACYTMSPPGNVHYPVYPGEDATKRLLCLLEAGREQRFPKGRGWTQVYEKRLDEELQAITQTGFEDYFCIVEDIVSYARALGKKDGKYYVGPGRGSAVGSLVCYLLNITTVDPVKEGLLFSRFLNTSRKTAPDIDIDIAPTIYDKVLAYCKSRYGDEAVSGISTRIRMGAMQALGYAASHHNASPQLTKTMKECIQNETESLAMSEELKQFVRKNKRAAQIYADALLLEGRQISWGQHPSGLVISDTNDISGRTPVMYNKSTGSWQTQLDMGDIERAGLLKIDFLKLRTLDVISETLQNMKQPVNPEDIPLDNKVFQEIFSKGNTVGVFQLESGGMQNLLKNFQPQDLEDLTLLISIYRPGPLQYAGQIIWFRKQNGFKKRTSSALNSILHCSYGFPIYQEQIMEIFHVIGGLSLPEADEIRRAVSKKKVEFLEPYRQRLISGLVYDGMTESQAKHLWEELIEFGHYSFNRSHAAAYARLAYITAYLKYHYPKEFLCALMNHSDKGRIPVLVAECHRNHISVLPPDICRSESDFSLCEDNKIRYGLSKINGISASAIQKILQVRSEHRFVSMKDFLERGFIDNQTTDLLIRSGAMDCWTNNRRRLLQWYPIANNSLSFLRKELEYNGETAIAALYRRRFRTSLCINMRAHTPKEVAEDEEQTLGCCITVDLLGPYRKTEMTEDMDNQNFDGFFGHSALCGFIKNLKILRRKKDGKEFAVFSLKDRTGEINAICFSDTYSRVKDNIVEGAAVKIWGEGKRGNQLIVDDIARLHAKEHPVIISVPGISKWSEIEAYIQTYSVPEGNVLLLQDRNNNKMYQAPFTVSELIYDIEWNEECYLVQDKETDDKEVSRVITFPSAA